MGGGGGVSKLQKGGKACTCMRAFYFSINVDRALRF